MLAAEPESGERDSGSARALTLASIIAAVVTQPVLIVPVALLLWAIIRR